MELDRLISRLESQPRRRSVQAIRMCLQMLLCQVAAEEEKLVAITAAMPDGTGLKKFSQRFPDRFFDVGIAEEHAVSFAAGLALGGVIPVVAIYSSFCKELWIRCFTMCACRSFM